MPAVSKSQQQAAGIAHAVEKGDLPQSKLRGASKQMFKSMKSGDLNKFASTKRKGLPNHMEGMPVTAKELFIAERDDAPNLGLGKTGLRFARMTSKQAFKPAAGGKSDAKWATSAKLRAELAHEKPGGKMKSMDKAGKVPSAVKESKWIKGAINPKHKGYCTPMTKSTCTPRRKAFARTMKKHHGFHEAVSPANVVKALLDD